MTDSYTVVVYHKLTVITHKLNSIWYCNDITCTPVVITAAGLPTLSLSFLKQIKPFISLSGSIAVAMDCLSSLTSKDDYDQAPYRIAAINNIKCVFVGDG